MLTTALSSGKVRRQIPALVIVVILVILRLLNLI